MPVVCTHTLLTKAQNRKAHQPPTNSLVIPANAGIHQPRPWIPGLRSTPPGMTGGLQRAEQGMKRWRMPMACTLTPRTKAQNRKPTRTQPTPSSFPRTRESINLGMDSGSPFHSARNDGEGFTKMSKAQGIGVYPWSAPMPSRRSHKTGKPTKTRQLPRHSRERGDPAASTMDSRSSFHSARNDGAGFGV